MFDAIKGFQREQGLRVDGLMSPSGPTARAINAALVEKVQRHGTGQKLPTGSSSESQSPSSPGFADSIPSGSGQDSLAGGSSYYREPSLATPKAFGQAGKQLPGAVEQSAEAIERAAKVAETPAQGVFASLAREGINADSVRRKYVALVEKASREAEGKLKRGVLSPREAATKASDARREILRELRKESTHLIREYAEQKKPESGSRQGRKPRKLDFYVEKYSSKQLRTFRGDRYVDPERNTFGKLTPEQQTKVWKKVIEGARRPNAKVTKWAEHAGRAGRALIVVSAALAVVNVLNAENKLEAILRETAKVAGGVAAGAAAGAAIGAAGFNPLTILIGVIAGGAAGAYGVEIGFDEIMEYLN